MTTKISAEVKGLKETQRAMERAVKDLRGTPMQNAMRDATLYVLRDAKINVPVDTGRLRASLTPAINSVEDTVQGIVGTEVTYAPYVEFNDTAKHTTGKAHFLEGAFDTNKDKIERRIGQAVDSIVRTANGG